MVNVFFIFYWPYFLLSLFYAVVQVHIVYVIINESQSGGKGRKIVVGFCVGAMFVTLCVYKLMVIGFICF